MMGFRKSALRETSDVLKAQHEALLGGDLEALSAMAPVLEAAFARLGREGADREDVAKVKAAAGRNARLIQAAQSGVTTARAYLTSSRSPELATYGADGSSHFGVSAASRTLMRR